MGNSRNKGQIQPEPLALLTQLERNELSAQTPELRYFEFGWNALHLAVYYGRVAAVANLLKSELCKELLDTPDANRDTPLHLSVSRNHFDLFKLLLQAGGKLTKYNKEEQLPLNLTASEDFFARVAKELVDSVRDQASKEVLDEYVAYVAENRMRINPDAFKEQPEDDEGAPLKQSNLNTPKPKRPTESQLQLQESNRDLTDNKYASDFGPLHVPKTPLKQGVAA